jgi:carbon dioxide concentrating mechanism protein CcmM
MLKTPGFYPLQQVIYPNPPVAEAPAALQPQIAESAAIGAGSMVIGDVRVGEDVFIGFHNVIRADASPPFYIGPRTNIQDFVMIHCHPGEYLLVNGYPMGLYLEGYSSILHHAAAHGPLFVGHNTFIGQHASIYDAQIGRNCVIMHGAVVTNKVVIADNRFVAPGQAVWTQDQADALPEVEDKYKGLNAQIVDYYYRLGKAYKYGTPLAF